MRGPGFGACKMSLKGSAGYCRSEGGGSVEVVYPQEGEAERWCWVCSKSERSIGVESLKGALSLSQSVRRHPGQEIALCSLAVVGEGGGML